MTRILLIAALLVSSVPVLADVPKSTVRIGAAYLSPASGTTSSEGFEWSFDDALGVVAGYEYRLGSVVGVAVSLGFFEPNARFHTRYADLAGKSRFVPLTLGPVFHVAKASSHVDVYVEPELAYVWYGATTIPFPDPVWDWSVYRVPVAGEDDVAWGLRTGLEFPLRPGRFQVQLEYLATSSSNQLSGVTLEMKPVILTAGFAWTF